jgi:acyl-CoA reductase-like NAD-dependent aldehyde dehydrogenase
MSTTTTSEQRAAEAPALPDGPRELLINGEFVAAADEATMPTHNPATGEVQAEVALAAEEDVDRAVDAARAAFKGEWGEFTPSARGKVLWRLADLVEEHADDLALLETLDNGKLLAEAQADIGFSAEVFRYYAGAATKIDGRTVTPSNPGQYHAYTRREPLGVVGQIIPWNFPVMMASWKVAPAIATGNSVVLKPAEQTPLSALLLGQLFLEAGLPAGALNVVNGPGETTGAALAAHDGVDKIAFTGSAETGRAILHAAAGNLKKVSLEMGGKSPNVVFSDADLEQATAMAGAAIFSHMGEVCIAASRLYVERDVFDDVVEGVAAAARDLKVGPGHESDSQLGPLVSDEQFQRVTGYVADGISAGARVLTGGAERHGDRGWFVKPTVLVDVEPEHSVVREEIFGPVLVARPFDDPVELAREANDTRYGLAAGVWTSDLSKAHLAAAELEAGMVFVNNWGAIDPSLPFGGYKESGWGRELGPDATDMYLETKTVVVAL